MKKVIVIVGPTASGKTSLSVKLAKKLGAEIINGDSVQIYKGLDVGSAKITEEEKQGVPHHLFDVCEPDKTYSVADFQKDVREKIKQIDIPMIVGGTGLYIKGALYDYEFEETERSQTFEKSYDDVDTKTIYNELIELDPKVTVDPQNRRRVIRALEQAKLGYKRSTKNKKDDLLYDACIIYLDIDRDILEKRLYKRLDIQLQNGFIDEVKTLFDQGIKINAIGYRELALYLENKLTLDEAKEEIIKKSRQLAKKQKTWFKNQMNPIMLNALSENLYQEAYIAIKTFLKE